MSGLAVQWRDDKHHSESVKLKLVFHMKDVRLASQHSHKDFNCDLNRSSSFTHLFEDIPWYASLFLALSHISFASSRTHCSLPGWPMHVTAGRLGLATGGRHAGFCLLSWVKHTGILTGLCLLGEVGYDGGWFPCESTDSVTQNVCTLPPLWETGYPV